MNKEVSAPHSREWMCRERYRTGHTCANVHIFDYALWYQLKEIMLLFLRMRTAVMKTCKDLIKKKVTDEERREKALEYLKNLRQADPDALDFGEEPAFIIREITVFPTNRLEVMLIDGMTVNYDLKKYTPKLGWWREQPVMLPENEQNQNRAQEPIELSEEEKRAAAKLTEAHCKHHYLTNEMKLLIDSMRRKGMCYKKVADTLHLNVNTVKSYCRRHPVIPPEGDEDKWAPFLYCKNCGAKVTQASGRKIKKFCSDACRQKWWNTHLPEVNRKSICEYECPVCGKKFAAYGTRSRKYCSHECYIKARFHSD